MSLSTSKLSTSAGVMTTIESSPQSSPLTRPGRKQKRGMEGIDPRQKPKKVNSEIRKQQNRIASRNYREKRKQKLQYLQRLLRDQDGNEIEQHEGSPSETSHDGRERSYSAEYHSQRPISSSNILPSNANFSPLPSNGRSMVESVVVPTSAYENHLLATSHPFPNLEPTWNTPMYRPQPQVPSHDSLWNLPPWMPSLSYTPEASTGAEDFQFVPQHTQQVYQQLPTPPQQTIELVSNPDLFILGTFTHCRRDQERQAQRNSNSPANQQPYNAHKRALWI